MAKHDEAAEREQKRLQGSLDAAKEAAGRANEAERRGEQEADALRNKLRTEEGRTRRRGARGTRSRASSRTP